MENKNSTFPYSNNPLSRGFTLIEIMLVVVIILIVTGVAVPKLSGSFSSTRMKDAVRSTIRVARYARSMAILEQADCTLSFAANRILLTTTNATLASRRLPDEIKITDFENMADKNIEGKNVLFYSSGMNDGFELTLSDDKNRHHTITCNPITGKVTLEED
ncbi:MAG: type II secretion system protein [Kiritimatiellales bacterium]|nr:type II secretion system protein [Kiritimatiellota bacterium]MBL7011989.1 type II secretion system protein [Kiritimatiellales bacterium]